MVMKEKNAYFTVEATLVLPFAIGAILFGIYMLLFQYNRCLVEQDAGMMAMWGSTLSGEMSEVEEQIGERFSRWYEGKYAAWETEKFQVQVHGKYVIAEMAGQLAFPVPEWNFWNKKNVWCFETGYRYARLNPVDFVRMCKKWKE